MRAELFWQEPEHAVKYNPGFRDIANGFIGVWNRKVSSEGVGESAGEGSEDSTKLQAKAEWGEGTLKVTVGEQVVVSLGNPRGTTSDKSNIYVSRNLEVEGSREILQMICSIMEIAEAWGYVRMFRLVEQTWWGRFKGWVIR